MIKQRHLIKTQIINYAVIAIVYDVNWTCTCGCFRNSFQEVAQEKKALIADINIEMVQEFKLKSFIHNKYKVSRSYWTTRVSQELKMEMCFVLSAIKFIKIY